MHRSLAALLLVLVATVLVGVPPALAQQSTDAPARPLSPERTAALPAPGPAAGTLSLTTERYRLGDGTFSHAERGHLFVPMDRSDPDSPVISVEVYRFPATTEAGAERPPIFRLFGGPGFEGITIDDLEEGDFYSTSIAPLRKIADVVVVGQRGIGSSRPNTRCDGPPKVPLDSVLTMAQERERIRSASRQCKQFWTEQGLDLQGLNVMEAAGDVNAVREAFGYDSMILRGQSFGSHWSMAVMRRYPETVERALLSGLEGPNATYDMPSGTLNSLERIAEDAEESDALAPHLPEGGLLQAFEDVVGRLKKAPVTVTVEHPDTGDQTDTSVSDVSFGYRDRENLAFGYGYDSVPDSLREMAGWPRDILELYNGDFTRAAKNEAEGHAGPPGFPTASFFMLDCGSGITPEREQTLNADPAIDLIGKPGAGLYQHACPVWASDLGNDFRTGFETDIPTVMVHGTWDLSTPLMNAKELQPAFANGTLVTVERGTHGAFWEAREESEDFAEGVRHFLKTGDRSRMPDTVTLPEVNWMGPDGSGGN